jgi:hypothetical protein
MVCGLTQAVTFLCNQPDIEKNQRFRHDKYRWHYNSKNEKCNPATAPGKSELRPGNQTGLGWHDACKD